VPYEFEYDPLKSQSNKVKHGIDFGEAQEIWSDIERVEIQAVSTSEPRQMVIGKWQQKH
jgi:uncharacterized protein